MRSLIITAFMIMLFALGLLQSGCGSRKVDVDILKQSEKIDEGSKDKGEEKKESEVKKENKEENKADKTEEVVTTVVKETYNPDGSINKRTTTTKKENRTDRSTNNKSSSESLKSFEYKSWIKTYWKTVTIKVKEKHKVSETSNTSFYVVIGVLGGIALLFLWLYVKARKRITQMPSMF